MQTESPLIRRRKLRNSKQTKHALNFDKFAAVGNQFLNDVARELHVSRNSAARITRAVLHAVRDRLPADDAVQFAQGLPMALKAVYFDQYDISDTPVVIRHAHDFLDYIFFKDEICAQYDFAEKGSVEAALSGIFNVLSSYMDPGQIQHIKRLLGTQIVELIEGREYHAQLHGEL